VFERVQDRWIMYLLATLSPFRVLRVSSPAMDPHTTMLTDYYLLVCVCMCVCVCVVGTFTCSRSQTERSVPPTRTNLWQTKKPRLSHLHWFSLLPLLHIVCVVLSLCVSLFLYFCIYISVCVRLSLSLSTGLS
jgi:hypothetical protein